MFYRKHGINYDLTLFPLSFPIMSTQTRKHIYSGNEYMHFALVIAYQSVFPALQSVLYKRMKHYSDHIHSHLTPHAHH